MKRKYIYIIAIILFLFLCVKIYKTWQYNSMGYRQPVLETPVSITETAKQFNIPGSLIIPKDTKGFDFINKYFHWGTIWVFDENKKWFRTISLMMEAYAISMLMKRYVKALILLKLKIQTIEDQNCLTH
jgi:hypothetical protein